jgi:hypothetical protein
MELSARAVGAMNVTPSDLARYPLLMLGRGTLDGRTYLTPESIARIERTETTTASKLGLPHGYGLTNFAIFHPKTVFRGHGGAIDGALALAEYVPGQGIGYVLMWTVQKENPAAGIIRSYLTRGMPQPPPPKAEPVEGGIERLTGQYQNIAVRQPFGAAFEALLEPFTVEAKDGKLVVAGKTYTHVGGLRFQAEDRSVPTLVFDVSSREPRALGASSFQRTPEVVVHQRMGWFIAFGLLSLFAVLHVFVWMHGILGGKLRSKGGLGLRVLPFLALGSIWALIGAILLISGMDTAVLLPAIGSQSYLALSLFAISLAIPIFGFLSFWRGLTAGYGAATWIRLYAIGAGAIALIAALYLNDYGWIGIMTWAR